MLSPNKVGHKKLVLHSSLVDGRGLEPSSSRLSLLNSGTSEILRERGRVS